MKINSLYSLEDVGHHPVELAWCGLSHFIEKVDVEKVDLTEFIATEIEL